MPNFSNIPSKTFLASAQLADDNRSVEQNDPFWTHATIEANRWNKVYPYQLLVVRKNQKGKYIQDQECKQWTYTLPFPPSSISIGTPFAIGGGVSQGGFVEEHNGAPVRNISFSGTTGVLPLRATAEIRSTPNLGQAIFGGTVEQASRVASSARSLASDATGVNTNFTPNLVDESLFDNPQSSDEGVVATTSGYYQFRVMQRFFENYASLKKTKKGRDFRLALAMWKDQSVYLVRPIALNVTRDAGSPLEYVYNLSFTAWRRVDLDDSGLDITGPYKPVSQDANAMARLLKGITDARDVLENARDIVSAVGGDLDRALFEPLRQLMMFAKDALSVPLAFADLPVQVLGSCQDAVVHWVATQQAFSGASDAFTGRSEAVIDAYKAIGEAAVPGGGPETGGLTGRQFQVAQNADAAYAVFRNPTDNYDLFKDIQPGKVQIPPIAVRQIQNERDRVRSLTRLDFENMRDGFVQLAADFADQAGAGHPTYNATFHRATVSTSKTPTPSDFRVMFALNRLIMEANRLAASGTVNQGRISSINFVAGLASRSGIAFRVPRSKFAVPFPYGTTVEQLAAQYLGDPDRWVEIAALNGLRAPWVDEEGFDLPLLVNGKDNQLSVSDSEHLFVGQQVWLSSNTTAQSIRHITRIEVLTDTLSVITVDGDADLERYHVSASAVLHAFLPDTVNSQMTLYIPSELAPLDEDFQLKAVPGLDVFDQLINSGGFDLLLTSTNDLAITPDGDCRLAVGLTNIVQTVRIRLSVAQGQLHRHPFFGLPIKVGESTADLDATTLLRAARNLFVDDPMFLGVESASVLKSGPGVTINLAVKVRGQVQTIPITLDLKR